MESEKLTHALGRLESLLIFVQIIPFGIFVCCVVEVRAVVLEEVAFGVLLPSLHQERRQLFVGHTQMLPSSRGVICSVRILHCSVQKVQDGRDEGRGAVVRPRPIHLDAAISARFLAMLVKTNS